MKLLEIKLSKEQIKANSKFDDYFPRPFYYGGYDEKILLDNFTLSEIKLLVNIGWVFEESKTKKVLKKLFKL